MLVLALLPPLARMVVAVLNHESLPTPATAEVAPTVTVYVFPGTTASTEREYDPPMPPVPPLVDVPAAPPCPPPQHSTVTEVTPAGQTQVPVAMYWTCIVWASAGVVLVSGAVALSEKASVGVVLVSEDVLVNAKVATSVGVVLVSGAVTLSEKASVGVFTVSGVATLNDSPSVGVFTVSGAVKDSDSASVGVGEISAAMILMKPMESTVSEEPAGLPPGVTTTGAAVTAGL
jgi:hypothetical protein